MTHVGVVLFAITFVIAGGVAGFNSCGSKVVAGAKDRQLIEKISRITNARIATDGVAGAVVVLIEDGASVWTGAFGLADPVTAQVMTADALFRVESISKPVTAWGAMRLDESGRLDLDMPVTNCLKRWQPHQGTPTLTSRQLLSHTAGIGLGDYAARYAPDAPRPELPDHMADDFEMDAEPGVRFAYSDTGYNLLELVIEDCTGEDFATFMAREVLAPLGMNQSGFDWTGPGMPVGHDLRGRPVAPYVYPGRASGGLHATVADIARFVSAGWAGAEQDILSPEGIAMLHYPAVPVGGLFGVAADGYGLGHFTETLSDGRTAVWHGGQGYGWMSHMHLVPGSGDGIVILSNSQRAWPLFGAILREWSKGLGVEPVGMSRVLWAETAARVAIALLLAGAVLAFWIAIRSRPRHRAIRIGAGGVGAALILWPLWAAAQDYLFLFSILPGLWTWLGAASGLAGLGAAALALAPARRR